MQIWNKLTLRRLLVGIGTHQATTYTPAPLPPTIQLQDPDNDTCVTLETLACAIFALLCPSDVAIRLRTLQSILFFSTREAQRFIESVHLACNHAHTPHQIEYNELVTYIGTARMDTLQQLIRVMKTDLQQWVEAVHNTTRFGTEEGPIPPTTAALPEPTPIPTTPIPTTPEPTPEPTPHLKTQQSSDPTRTTVTLVPPPIQHHYHPISNHWFRRLFCVQACIQTTHHG